MHNKEIFSILKIANYLLIVNQIIALSKINLYNHNNALIETNYNFNFKIKFNSLIINKHNHDLSGMNTK